MGLDTGKVQIYTGNGKGKTTAALGLCLRALGRGLTPLFLQFAKTLQCGEHIQASKIGLVIVQGKGDTPYQRDLSVYEHAYRALVQHSCDVLVLDELGEALRVCHITESQLDDLLQIRPKNVELILTGRHLEHLDAKCDLMTIMQPAKHYFDEGLFAREGIEW